MKGFSNVWVIDYEKVANFATMKLQKKENVSDDVQVALKEEEALNIIKPVKLHNPSFNLKINSKTACS